MCLLDINIYKEPFFFCYKVCPLYCSPRRRYDDDTSSLIYSDDELPYIYEEPEEIYPHSFHFCKPKPTTSTTTQATTTTTEEPTFICLMCKKKCNKKST
ncbi:unnamed protein product [Pieris brassicae]|uniref:Uncharacterized protein n=1 Tax=Pieris brassicae TaxID=7116 RepID=A0A9P0TGM0_PIEBR|nr:unnamed protein product [Pieris brassicae]